MSSSITSVFDDTGVQVQRPIPAIIIVRNGTVLYHPITPYSHSRCGLLRK
ncbi:hypothetical protein [Methanolobus psychrotolerans]|nr:hypothetical protein [Methanolobus psychrotolerans]